MRLDFETSAAEETDFAVADASDFNFSNASPSGEPPQKLKAGIEAARAGNRAEARLLLLEVADAEPDNEDVWLHLASVGEYPEEVRVFLNNALQINPSNERARQWARQTEQVLADNFAVRGIAAKDAGQNDYARQYFRQSLALDERHEAAWLGLAAIVDSDEERQSHYERVLSVNPENETALQALAEARERTVERLLTRATAEAFAGDYDAAEDTLDSVFAQTADAEEAWLLRAFLTPSLDEKNECWESVLRLNAENELARAGTAFMRCLKSKLITPLEKEVQEKLQNSDGAENGMLAVAAENSFSPEATEDIAEQSPAAENVVDLTNLYSVYSIPEPDDADCFVMDSDDSETFEIAVDEDEDLSVYYEQINEENPVFDSPAARNVESDSLLLEEAKAETRAENDAERQTSEQMIFGAAPAVESETGEAASNKIACPFCRRENEPQAFVCPCCSAVLTLSDLEMLLAHNDADCETVRQAVERMESEKDLPEFGTNELKFLGIGKINLKHFRQGFSYLQRAAQLNPNDVLLAAQINALAIRLSEIEEQASIHSSMPKNKTILVVDDSATVRKLISSKLEKSGHEVLCAVDGVDALEKIEATVPDLILLDITMPRMDGYTVCKMIRTNEKTKDVPVVMISGKDGFFDKVRGRMAGTTGYITKPFGPETLMKMVENYIV